MYKRIDDKKFQVEMKNKPVFVYCRSGNRSTFACKTMESMGFQRIFELKQGIMEWSGEIEE